MVITISDAGIFKTDNSSYPMTKNSPVSKVSSVKPIDDQERSVIRDAEQKAIAGNTPAYNITISSMGKAALESLKAIDKSLAVNLNKVEVTTDNTKKTNTVFTSEEEDTSSNKNQPLVEEEDLDNIAETRSNTTNLGIYSESKLRDLVSKGEISRADMDKEMDKRQESGEDITSPNADPVIKQAIAAYNFQLSFQIHSAMMQ